MLGLLPFIVGGRDSRGRAPRESRALLDREAGIDRQGHAG